MLSCVGVQVSISYRVCFIVWSQVRSRICVRFPAVGRVSRSTPVFISITWFTRTVSRTPAATAGRPTDRRPRWPCTSAPRMETSTPWRTPVRLFYFVWLAFTEFEGTYEQFCVQRFSRRRRRTPSRANVMAKSLWKTTTSSAHTWRCSARPSLCWPRTKLAVDSRSPWLRMAKSCSRWVLWDGWCSHQSSNR